MSHPKTLEVIVISDSDLDDDLQPSTSSVSLIDSIARSPGTINSNATSSGHPATPRGKSEPTLHATGLGPGPPAETRIRQRQTRSLPHDVIDVDADDEPSDSDGPSVSFQITPFVLDRMTQTNNYPCSQNGPELPVIGLHHRCYVQRPKSTSEHGVRRLA